MKLPETPEQAVALSRKADVELLKWRTTQPPLTDLEKRQADFQEKAANQLFG